MFCKEMEVKVEVNTNGLKGDSLPCCPSDPCLVVSGSEGGSLHIDTLPSSFHGDDTPFDNGVCVNIPSVMFFPIDLLV
jgi:hypothetical protein